jgi:hypothetical protein|tara:strand:+ start:311 stop:1075 length:765 start_codon:yes stop_codon:yes gene_type:complete
MKLNDDITMSIADSVSAVLEGKKIKEEEEVTYPHDMWSPEGKKVSAKDEAEHKDLMDKGYTHEAPDVDESPEEPKAKGEKEFKGKHKVKKSGDKEDGTVVKEESEEVAEGELPPALKAAIAKKKAKDGDKDEVEEDKHEDEDEDEKEVKEAGDPLEAKAVKIAKEMGGDMTGAVKKIEKLKKGLSKAKAVDDALRLANESVQSEASAKQEKYKKFFQSALKKFGVKSPAELEGDKKKEFFDYVDKNYESDNEED